MQGKIKTSKETTCSGRPPLKLKHSKETANDLFSEVSSLLRWVLCSDVYMQVKIKPSKETTFSMRPPLYKGGYCVLYAQGKIEPFKETTCSGKPPLYKGGYCVLMCTCKVKSDLIKRPPVQADHLTIKVGIAFWCTHASLFWYFILLLYWKRYS